MVLQTEGLPCVYYTPSYGYTQSPYNPYNSYIPGAVIGVDGQFVGAEQYYTGPAYQQPVSSPSYFPVIVQSRPDIVPNISPDASLLSSGASSATRSNGAGWKHIPSPVSAGMGMVGPRAASRDVRTESSQTASHLTHSSYNASLSKRTSHGAVPQSTSSHVTQILYMPGVEMLRIFKSYPLKTSILDDVMYYEDRQKIMHDEKSRLHSKSYEPSFFLPAFVPSRKLDGAINQPLEADDKPIRSNDLNDSGKTVLGDEMVTLKLDAMNSSISTTEKNVVVEDVKDMATVMKIRSVSIDPKENKADNSGAAVESDVPVGVVTVGSMPVKVNGFAEASPATLTIGTIPISPRAQTLKRQDPPR